MRPTVVALCFISLAAPASATLRASPGIESRKADAQHRSGRRADSLTAETSANGIGWKQFVTASDGGPSWPRPASLPVAPELASWALMVSGIGIAGSLLRRGSVRKI